MVDAKTIEDRVDTLLDEVDLAAKDTDVELRRLRIVRVVEQLEEIQSKGLGPMVSYALGYSLYAHPDRISDQTISDAVDRHLKNVLRSKPHDALSWLYLGHNAYDLGKFEVALENFSKAAEGELPDYLALKALEMRLCCQISCLGLGATLESLESFVEAVEGHSAEDIWPQELAKVIHSRRGEVSSVLRSKLAVLFARLDRAGTFGTWFSELLPDS